MWVLAIILLLMTYWIFLQFRLFVNRIAILWPLMRLWISVHIFVFGVNANMYLKNIFFFLFSFMEKYILSVIFAVGVMCMYVTYVCIIKVFLFLLSFLPYLICPLMIEEYTLKSSSSGFTYFFVYFSFIICVIILALYKFIIVIYVIVVHFGRFLLYSSLFYNY